MQTILITGNTGVGKSRLLCALAMQHQVAVIDPLVEARGIWMEPAVSSRGVAIDHFSYLDEAKDIVAAATAWCEQYAVDLWLCDFSLMDFERKGITVPADAIELHLKRDVWPWPVTVTPGKRITASFDQALSLACQLVEVVECDWRVRRAAPRR